MHSLKLQLFFLNVCLFTLNENVLSMFPLPLYSGTTPHNLLDTLLNLIELV